MALFPITSITNYSSKHNLTTCINYTQTNNRNVINAMFCPECTHHIAIMLYTAVCLKAKRPPNHPSTETTKSRKPLFCIPINSTNRKRLCVSVSVYYQFVIMSHTKTSLLPDSGAYFMIFRPNKNIAPTNGEGVP